MGPIGVNLGGAFWTKNTPLVYFKPERRWQFWERTQWEDIYNETARYLGAINRIVRDDLGSRVKQRGAKGVELITYYAPPFELYFFWGKTEDSYILDVSLQNPDKSDCDASTPVVNCRKGWNQGDYIITSFAAYNLNKLRFSANYAGAIYNQKNLLNPDMVNHVFSLNVRGKPIESEALEVDLEVAYAYYKNDLVLPAPSTLTAFETDGIAINGSLKYHIPQLAIFQNIPLSLSGFYIAPTYQGVLSSVINTSSKFPNTFRGIGFPAGYNSPGYKVDQYSVAANPQFANYVLEADTLYNNRAGFNLSVGVDVFDGNFTLTYGWATNVQTEATDNIYDSVKYLHFPNRLNHFEWFELAWQDNFGAWTAISVTGDNYLSSGKGPQFSSNFGTQHEGSVVRVRVMDSVADTRFYNVLDMKFNYNLGKTIGTERLFFLSHVVMNVLNDSFVVAPFAVSDELLTGFYGSFVLGWGITDRIYLTLFGGMELWRGNRLKSYEFTARPGIMYRDDYAIGIGANLPVAGKGALYLRIKKWWSTDLEYWRYNIDGWVASAETKFFF